MVFPKNLNVVPVSFVKYHKHCLLNLIKKLFPNSNLLFLQFFTRRSVKERSQISNIGSNTPDQGKNTKAVKTNGNEENDYSKYMEADMTTTHENLGVQRAAVVGPYSIEKEPLVTSYTFPKNNRLPFLLFLPLFLLCSCSVHNENCNT